MAEFDLCEWAQRFYRCVSTRDRLSFESDDLDDDYRRAFQRLQNAAALRSADFARRSIFERPQCHPDILKFSDAFLSYLRRYDLPFFVHGAYRSDAEQEELFRQGVTKARARQSAHNFGKAVDIVHYGFYWELTRTEWDLLGAIGKDVASTCGVKVTWGGDFKSIWDPAHWELRDWK